MIWKGSCYIQAEADGLPSAEKARVLTASKDDKMLYSADIDLQETIKSKKDIRELILKKFQNKGQFTQCGGSLC